MQGVYQASMRPRHKAAENTHHGYSLDALAKALQ